MPMEHSCYLLWGKSLVLVYVIFDYIGDNLLVCVLKHNLILTEGKYQKMFLDASIIQF